MKKFWDFIKKSSEAQVKKISIIISAIIATVFFIIVSVAYIIAEQDIILCLAALVPAILLFIWSYLFLYFMFEGREKKLLSEAKQEIIPKYGLNKESYIELNPKYEVFFKNSRYSKVLITIFKSSSYKYKYYAKLTENEEIELIVKDTSQNIVYSDTLDDFLYFEDHFDKLS